MVKWSQEAEEAFTSLKKALCSHPVLAVPDFNKEFVVQVDASEVGLGAVLSQIQKAFCVCIRYEAASALSRKRERYSNEQRRRLSGGVKRARYPTSSCPPVSVEVSDVPVGRAASVVEGTVDVSGRTINKEGPIAFERRVMAGVTRVLGAFRSLKDAFPWLKVAGNTALAGVLFGLETLLEMSKPCPCDPELNGRHVAVVFLVPALTFFMISLTALPDSRRLLKGWACRRLIVVKGVKGVVESKQEHWCRRCCHCKRCRFTLITLLEALMPSVIWFSILLLDGDHFACSSQTQADVQPGHSQGCKHICSDDPTPQLRRNCNISWIYGSVLMAASVCLLTILHFIPARDCDDCTKDCGCLQGYYEAEFNNKLEDAREIKMEENMKERAATRADVEAQKLMEDLTLSDPAKKDQDPSSRDKVKGSRYKVRAVVTRSRAVGTRSRAVGTRSRGVGRRYRAVGRAIWSFNVSFPH
ncbi:uncharacterized protein LOC144602865 [Rhinoraja longicauda]